MKNIISSISLFVLIISLYSCATHVASLPSTTPSGPRTIVLEGDTISEEDVGKFTCWYCKDYGGYGSTLVEVGHFNFPDSLKSVLSEEPVLVDLIELGGFILYDGGSSGDYSIYMRTGLEHNWYWGPDTKYQFTIKPDGTGLYYDFTTVPEGESTKPRDLYKCYKR
ncbi:MAG: hypothetical protein JRJ57_08330 [Deltaproteobacteria bacterium]|nr:hypothetical protein [Deltaproteobacteria bacterium]